jgi:hypothetical protein
MTADPIETGALFRAVHRHAWRADAPPLELELSEVVALMPLLIQTGSVGLVWPRLRHRAGEYGAIGLALEAAYRGQVEHNAKVEREIAHLVGHLQSHGIDPVLIKGWAMSRLYPAGLVRPAGDIDIVVPDDDYDRAKQLLATSNLSLHEFDADQAPHGTASASDALGDVDLHTPTHWEDDPGPALFTASLAVPLDGLEVRVPSAEEHIRALTFHFLRHGGVRALRLCDIALLFEARPADFDWERCLGEDPTRTNWVLTAAALANHLVGATIEGTPAAKRVRQLPPWLLPVAERRLQDVQVDPSGALTEFLAQPRQVGRVLRRRWPDPIAATVRLPAPFGRFPRLPLQWAVYLRHLGGYAMRRFPKQLAAHVRPSR